MKDNVLMCVIVAVFGLGVGYVATGEWVMLVVIGCIFIFWVCGKNIVSGREDEAKTNSGIFAATAILLCTTLLGAVGSFLFEDPLEPHGEQSAPAHVDAAHPHHY